MLPRTRSDRLVVREVEDEVLVYDLARHRAHCLNPAAALVWRRCDGASSPSGIAEALHDELGLPCDEGIVEAAVEQLRRAHLVEDGDDPPRAGDRISRRALGRKLGLVGGMMVMLPLVSTIVAPTPAEAASCVNCNGASDCSKRCCAGGTCVCVGPSRQCKNL